MDPQVKLSRQIEAEQAGRLADSKLPSDNPVKEPVLMTLAEISSYSGWSRNLIMSRARGASSFPAACSGGGLGCRLYWSRACVYSYFDRMMGKGATA